MSGRCSAHGRPAWTCDQCAAANARADHKVEVEALLNTERQLRGCVDAAVRERDEARRLLDDARALVRDSCPFVPQWATVLQQRYASFLADNAAPVPAQPASVPEAVAKDAARYRWLRDRKNSLETRQYDKGIYNGPSCYHEVEGIRELKSESKLDAAIDAAILSASDAEVKNG